MHVGSEPGVVSEVPPGMIRVLIDDNRIRVPQPVSDVPVIKWRHTEVIAAEPEPRAIAALEPENMAGAESASENTVFKGALHTESCVIPLKVMADPMVIVRHVRRVRVSCRLMKLMPSVPAHRLWPVLRDVAASGWRPSMGPFMRPSPLLRKRWTACDKQQSDRGTNQSLHKSLFHV